MPPFTPLNSPYPPTLPRRQLLRTAAAGLLLPGLAWAAAPTSAPAALEVWKDPHCGCCQDWIEHMRAHGFNATVHDSGNSAVRARLGLPAQLGSCHTALIGGYLLEGHVPAADVQKLLAQKPLALGLAVPGMPVGSPGMDGPAYQGRKDPYDVLLVTKNTSGSGVATRVFTRYR